MPQPRRLALTALLTGLLLVAPALAQARQMRSLREENTVRIGPWSVWCARDGNLSGLDHEECRFWLGEDHAIMGSRDYDGLIVSIYGPLCTKASPLVLPEAQALHRRALASPRRALARFEGALDSAADTCGVPRRKFNRAKLRALLAETSGLSNEKF